MKSFKTNASPKAIFCVGMGTYKCTNGIFTTDNKEIIDFLSKNPNFEEVGGEVKLASMKVADLKKLAEEKEINLGDATTKADILAILEAN